MKSSRFNLLAIFAAVAMCLFFLTRLALLAYSWSQTDLSAGGLLQVFGRGMLFDAGFCAYALVAPALYLWLVPQRLWRLRLHRCWARFLLFTGFYALILIAIAEYFFWDEFSVRFNFIAIDYLIYRREVTDNIFQSYPVCTILAGVLVIAALIYFSLRRPINRALFAEERFSWRTTVAGVALLLPLVIYAGLDQSLRTVSVNAYQNELASNGPYQFVAAFRNNELDYLKFYASLPPEQASVLLKQQVAEPNATFLSGDLFDIRRDIVPAGTETRLNIILVMVESLSSDYLAFFGNREHLTPNLDGLSDKSLFFSKFYATGTRTTRGLEAVTLSIPPTPGRSIVKRIGHESNQCSLGNVLNSKGYQSFFIYGGRSYFDNMGAFFSGNGYQVVDQTSVPDSEIDFTNAWGMSDTDLYRQAIKVAGKTHAEGKPFSLHLMTTSNHRPYTYPEGQIDIPSGTSRAGAVKYTDHAIGEFLANAAQQPWFNDTLFVIVADHQAGSSGKHALPIERYHIPLWIYAPQLITPDQIDHVSSQIDLAPTLLSLLNMSYRSNFFGKNILAMAPAQERALIGNYQNLGLFDGNSMAILSPQQKMQLQEGLTSDSITEHPAQKSETLIQRDISYYQGAAYVYRNQLNAWQSPADVVANAKITGQSSRSTQ
ncbi:MAG: LTA synthase family protein [Desulfuromonadales bacterium]